MLKTERKRGVLRPALLLLVLAFTALTALTLTLAENATAKAETPDIVQTTSETPVAPHIYSLSIQDDALVSPCNYGQSAVFSIRYIFGDSTKASGEYTTAELAELVNNCDGSTVYNPTLQNGESYSLSLSSFKNANIFGGDISAYTPFSNAYDTQGITFILTVSVRVGITLQAYSNPVYIPPRLSSVDVKLEKLPLLYEYWSDVVRTAKLSYENGAFHISLPKIDAQNWFSFYCVEGVHKSDAVFYNMTEYEGGFCELDNVVQEFTLYESELSPLFFDNTKTRTFYVTLDNTDFVASDLYVAYAEGEPKPETFTVTVDLNGWTVDGQTSLTYEVEAGLPIVDIPVPQREGYNRSFRLVSFWPYYVGYDYSVCTNNMQFKMLHSLKSYVVKFYNGDTLVDRVSYKHGDKLSNKLPAFSVDGYSVFGSLRNNAGGFVSGDTPVTSALNLTYVLCKQGDYFVEFHADGKLYEVLTVVQGSVLQGGTA